MMEDVEEKTITVKELKRLCFCNSPELIGKIFIIGGHPYEWEGIGMFGCNPDPKRHIKVIE